ncbi:MAG: hypothetical protein WA678_03745 [Rhabdochlamydiaceae bacterium]
MPDIRVFDASVFESYANLQSFFNRSPAIQEVLSKKNEPYSGIPIPLNANLACRWRVCQMTTAPFRWALAIFLKISAAGLACCGFSGRAKDLKRCAIHLIIGFDVFSNETTKVAMIMASENHPNKEGEIVNTHPLIPESQSPVSVTKRTYSSVHNHEIRFNYKQGICRGISNWFLYLYLKTKNQFPDPRAHMAALGEQFKNGGGMDPTLLQSIFLRKGKLLDLKIGTQPAHSTTVRHPVSSIEHPPHRWKTSSTEMIDQLKTLPPGAYTVRVPSHRMAFVKIDDRLGFFFNPNEGIIEICGNELGEKLYTQITYALKNVEEAVSSTLLRGNVYFEQVTLRS